MGHENVENNVIAQRGMLCEWLQEVLTKHTEHASVQGFIELDAHPAPRPGPVRDVLKEGLSTSFEEVAEGDPNTSELEAPPSNRKGAAVSETNAAYWQQAREDSALQEAARMAFHTYVAVLFFQNLGTFFSWYAANPSPDPMLLRCRFTLLAFWAAAA